MSTKGKILRALGLVVCCVFFVSACAQPATFSSLTPGPDTSSSSATSTDAVIERVVDGDTLIVTEAGQRTRVRLIGIDAPESVKPGSPVECFGPEASKFLKDLLPAQSPVQLEADPAAGDQDKYGRQLRTVRTPDGSNVSVLIAAAGMGREYVYDRVPSRYAQQIHAAQTEAQQRGSGLWAGC